MAINITCKLWRCTLHDLSWVWSTCVGRRCTHNQRVVNDMENLTRETKIQIFYQFVGVFVTASYGKPGAGTEQCSYFNRRPG